MAFQKTTGLSLAVVAMFAGSAAKAISLDDIQLWTGAGTNRAALVVEWSTPEVFNNSSVATPAAQKSLAWGFRWNGTANAEDMFNAILAADKQLFAVVSDNTTYGKAVLAIGYDLNNNRLFGVRNGTNVLAYSSLTNAPSAFTNGLVTLDYGDSDVFQSLDPADLYWGGWYGPNWELWQEQGGHGGFTNAPSRGTNSYWTPDDPENPYTGNDGQWHYADFGMSGIVLSNGSWIGWSVAAGGLDFGDPESPGTIAWGLHKHAPSSPLAAPTNTNPYAIALVASQEPFGPSPYNDPTAVLGEPTSLAVNFDPVVGNSPFHIKLVEPAYNRDVDGQKVIVTLNRTAANGGYTYGSVTIKFDHLIHDDPANPYGVDFEVFGNTFYVGNGFVSDASDMRTYNLVGGAFAEPMLVSVSPDGTNWYAYTNGPSCDSTFPTQGYEWDANQYDAITNGWTKKRMDFTKPVNPALDSVIGALGVTMPALDAIKLYAGSGGGTGFDLAESGFAAIQYIRVDAAAGFYAGEVDAFSAVRPAVLGECLTIAPGNLSNNTGTLFFQDPGDTGNNILKIGFQNVSDVALVTGKRFQNAAALASLSNNVIGSADVIINPVLSGVSLQFTANIALNIGSVYAADGRHLDAFSWDGTNWTRASFTFDSKAKTVNFEGVTNSLSVAVVQISPPLLAISRDSSQFTFGFTPVAGWMHTLERTTDFSAWTTVLQLTPTNNQPVIVPDANPPVNKAFYRLRLNKP